MSQADKEIGNHTMSHVSLAGLPYDRQLAEIDGAARAIADVLGARPRFFCYPLGHHDANTISIVRKTGHVAAVTISDGTLHSLARRFRLPRVRMRAETDLAELAWLVNRRL